MCAGGFDPREQSGIFTWTPVARTLIDIKVSVTDVTFTFFTFKEVIGRMQLWWLAPDVSQLALSF